MRDVTFVVQGPIHPETAMCLRSIRTHYPDSRIVTSTWKSASTNGIDCDELVLNDDPGGAKSPPGSIDNVNRQIVSTRNGLVRVQTTYAVKIRSDCSLFARSLQRPSEAGSLFRNKIIALDLYFKDPIKSNFLFHPGDIFQFGRTEDLLDLWQIPLSNFAPSRTGFKSWLLNNPIFKARRYVPEQYIWVSFLRKASLSADIGFPLDFELEQFSMSEQSIAQNFIIKTYDELGLHIPSRLLGSDVRSVYTASDLDRILKFGPRNSMARKEFLRRYRREILRRILRPRHWRR